MGGIFIELLKEALRLHSDNPTKFAQHMLDRIKSLPPAEQAEVRRDLELPAAPLPPGFREDDPAN